MYGQHLHRAPLALDAHRGCRIASRARTPDGHAMHGWAVDLEPEHFMGRYDAEIRHDDSAPYPSGTAVQFQATETADAIHAAIANAARHYPLPVMLEGMTLERRAFLDGAIHAEGWNGLTFGVYRNRRGGYIEPDLNFFELTVPVRLPTVETVHGGIWSVRADVLDCPGLELLLPARREAVETHFSPTCARRHAWRSTAPWPPIPSRVPPLPTGHGRATPASHSRRRRKSSVPGGPASPTSTIGGSRRSPHRPAAMRWSWPAIPSRPRRRRCGAPPSAPALRTGSSRPTSTSKATPGMTGSTASRASTPRSPPTARRGRSTTSPCPRGRGRPAPRCRHVPPRSAWRLPSRPPAPGGRTLEIPADLAFAGEAWNWVGEALPLVTADSTLEPHRLAELLRFAFFSASDDADADSSETQAMRFDEEALQIATRLLCSEDSALEISIAETVRRELFWLVPHNRTVEISITRPDVRVTLGDPVKTAT